MALPSACSAQTGRSGAGDRGGRWRREGPTRWRRGEGEPVVAGRAGGGTGRPNPEVTASSTTIAPSGSSAPMTAAAEPTSSGPVGSCGRDAGARRAVVPGATRSASSASASAGGTGPTDHRGAPAPRPDQVAVAVGVGEEGHRRARSHQHDVLRAAELVLGRLAGVAQPPRRRDPGAALERIGNVSTSSRAPVAAAIRSAAASPRQRGVAADQQDARARRRSARPRRRARPRPGRAARGGGFGRHRGPPTVAPADVGGQHQGRDPPGACGRPRRRRCRRRRGPGRTSSAPSPTPTRRSRRCRTAGARPGARGRCRWSPITLTTGTPARRALCRLASPLPRPAPGAAGSPRDAGHPGVAVGGAGGDPLEQRQHAAHRRDAVERGDEVHLRGPGLAKQTRHRCPRACAAGRGRRWWRRRGRPARPPVGRRTGGGVPVEVSVMSGHPPGAHRDGRAGGVFRSAAPRSTAR
jgi:hypothetical protein